MLLIYSATTNIVKNNLTKYLDLEMKSFITLKVKFVRSSQYLSEAATGGVLQENLPSKISGNSQENTCAKVSLQAEAYNLI